MRSFLSAVLLALSGIAAVAGQPTCNRASDDLRGSTYIHMPYVGNSIACQLQRGDNSEAVRALQQQINMCYYSYQNRKWIGSPLQEDGDFGGKTEAAVKVVQRHAGASVDGGYGAETRGKMQWGHYYEANPGYIVCLKLTEWDQF